MEKSRTDYLREVVTLFLPWRSEETDIINANLEHIFAENATTIEDNRRKYNMFEDTELQSLLEMLYNENNEDDMDEIAASQVLDDEFRALAIPDIGRNVNVFVDNDGTEDNEDEDVRLIKLPPLLTENELYTMVRSLNRKQREYYAHVLHNYKNQNVFQDYVGGGAGVGKSRLISVLYQSITMRENSLPGSDPGMVKVLLCAPTGKAAFGIGGLTLHSLFSLPVNQSSSELRPLSSDVVNGLYAKFMLLKVIIIDEISMVGAKMFSHLDARLKQIFKNNNYFGGMSLIVFGDLKQLSPVGDRWIFLPNRTDAYSAITGTPLWDLFKFYELTEIMRQREDLFFATALNNMSEGRMTEDDVQLIKQRIVSEADIPRDVIHLFYSNADVSQFNAIKLAEINTEELVSTALDKIKALTLTERSKQQILAAVKSFKASETQGLSYELKLKTTAKYMVTVNVNTNDGLVNGASGELMQIDRTHIGTTTHITGLWMKFMDHTVGIIARGKQPHGIHSDWTRIEPVVRTFQYKRNDQVCIERKQFPVVPAEAITIHKSQGATYEKVALHVKSGMTRSALYVGCSRATSASGLFIVGPFIPPKPFGENDVVWVELTKLRNEKALRTHYDCALDRTQSSLRLYYQNVQSLPKHIIDIQSDHLICSSDILCFVETWARHGEEFNIDGFNIVANINGQREQGTGRAPNGIMIFAKHEISGDISILFDKNICRNGRVYQLLSFRHGNTSYIVVYRNGRYPIADFRDNLIYDVRRVIAEQNGPTIVVGDFNVCRLQGVDRLERRLNEEGLSSVLGRISTTKQNTQIDWLFSTEQEVRGTTYETVYSHHEGLFILR